MAVIMDNVQIHRTGPERWLLACCMAAGFSPIGLVNWQRGEKKNRETRKSVVKNQSKYTNNGQWALAKEPKEPRK